MSMSPVSAYDFCSYFDFTLSKESGFVDNEYYTGEYNYKAEDNQGTYHTRYVLTVEDLVDAFDYLLPDYVERVCEDCGFVEKGSPRDYYKDLLEWIETSELNGTDTHNIVKVIVHPDLLVDEV